MGALKRRKGVYLAGPEVFLPDAVEVGRRKVDICTRLGLVGLFPLELDRPVGPATSAAVFQDCVAQMRQANAIIANLTPFRGVGADPGTAFELGYMVARGLQVFGYTNEPATLRDRVRGGSGLLTEDEGGLFASDGFAVEDFGLFDNLMLAEALLASGPGVFTPPQAVADSARDLATFERCAAHAAERLLTAG